MMRQEDIFLARFGKIYELVKNENYRLGCLKSFDEYWTWADCVEGARNTIG